MRARRRQHYRKRWAWLMWPLHWHWPIIAVYPYDRQFFAKRKGM